MRNYNSFIQFLPTTTVIRSVQSKFWNESKVTYSLKRDPALAMALAIINSFFDGFLIEYEKYLRDPDMGSLMLTDRELSNDNWRRFYKQPTRFVKRNLAEGWFLSVVIILSILKPFADHKHAYRVRRKRYNEINDLTGTLAHGQERFLIGITTMQDLEFKFRNLPKLKSTILAGIATTIKSSMIQPVHSYLLKILIQSRMKMFIIIDFFLAASEKTKAHNNCIVRAEINSYISARDTIRNCFGDLYYLAEVLNPSITDIIVYNWPCLGAAALTYVEMKYSKNASLEIFKVSNMDFTRLVQLKNEACCLPVSSYDKFYEASQFLDALFGNLY